MFQLEISGNDDKLVQLQNILPISVTLLVFQLEISGNDDKLEHL